MKARLAYKGGPWYAWTQVADGQWVRTTLVNRLTKDIGPGVVSSAHVSWLSYRGNGRVTFQCPGRWYILVTHAVETLQERPEK